MAKISERIGRSQAVILPARLIRFEIEAISTSKGFDPFCPWRRQKALRYIRASLSNIVLLLDMPA
jgi:hypothetical protein